jgi:hypothetical protein
LADHILLWPGFFLWYFGFAQVVILTWYLFVKKSPHQDWKWMRFLACGTFLWVFLVSLFTLKNPDINIFYEIMPIPLIYSLYVWEKWWTNRNGKLFLQFFLIAALVFQVGYVFTRIPLKESLYSMYRDQFTAAVDQKNYHLLGERRPGALY